MANTSAATPSLYVQLSVTKAIKDAAEQNEKAVKTALAQVMAAGDRKTADLAGADLGTVSMSKTQPKAYVADPSAFLDWCVNNHPTEVTTPVTLDATTLLRAMVYCRDALGQKDPDPQVAEFKEEWQRTNAAIIAADSVVRPAFTEHVLAKVKKAKAPVDPDTGEVIDGIEYDKGGAAGYVSCRLSEDQRQGITDAWQRGDLDLVELATVPPAITTGTDPTEDQ